MVNKNSLLAERNLEQDPANKEVPSGLKLVEFLLNVCFSSPMLPMAYSGWSFALGTGTKMTLKLNYNCSLSLNKDDAKVLCNGKERKRGVERN